MLRSLWTKTLRDRRWAVLGWGLGLAALSFGILLVHPIIAGAAGLSDYVDELPPIFLALLGEEDLLSAAGFVNAELFHFLVPFVLISCAVGVGVDVVAGGRERRTLELLLAQPLSRSRLVLEGFLATVAVVATLALFVWLGLVLGVLRAGADLDPLNLLGATVSAALVGLCYGSLGLALGALLERKGPCVAIAGAAVTGGFLLHSVGTLVPGMAGLRHLSPFFYYRLGDPVRNGLAWDGATTLVAIALAGLLAAVSIAERRDVV